MKIAIITHGPLAIAMKESVRMFFGDTADEIAVLGLYPTDSPDALLDAIVKVVEESKQEILLFVDIQSGSPYNMSAVAIESLKDQYQMECISGVNMPLLMEVLGMKDTMSLAEMMRHIETIAPSTITNLRKTLDI